MRTFARRYGDESGLPQLVGLALGFTPAELRTDRHIVDAGALASFVRG